MENSRITTLIFDVDDTLYDVGTGFTAHRNGEIVQKFMVDELNFPDQASVRSGQVAREFSDLCAGHSANFTCHMLTIKFISIHVAGQKAP